MPATLRDDRNRLDVERISPVELVDALDAVLREQRAVAETDHEPGIVAFGEFGQRRDVHVVVVVVTNENQIDRWELVEC